MINIKINKRIKEIREDINLSQQKFGEKLGVSRDVISNIENNRVEVKTVFINHMCEIFNINKEWILTGEGEIYISVEDDILLGEAFADITMSENEKIKKIVMNLCKLDDIYIDAMCTIIDGIISNKTNEK
ncbi:TPA: helix-turn-helix transcriptional regulator [Clostridioides difficile]|uniref:helix-turn-helix domain-containing protein n=1 Tax=Clostridioides difficile TaxID=1496 RepID=UPI000938EF20|nr:helix-turn-helix transcriptional regulator [Clostridioides difficile]HDN2472203.1 helix-turn-helix transcriptional regulator [Clostridioides difficile CD196]EGT4169757.1 XRE family transcriptional regulator [Clostridioides difficile]EGT4186798.1 XRE family transcriptional regulator [Clostridioides difficile]EGT4537504.1 XRE family transcriptional regulator [Clostridioides difficile]EGT4658558.1 XRE family transcriptional regulator [Clostridioides difficile]